jgi:glycosyltransferase involved in cell wall biosynthesis
MSNNVRDSLLHVGVNESALTVLPPRLKIDGYGPKNKSKRIREQVNGPSGLPIVLFVGNTKKDKGLDILIKSLSRLKSKVRFVFTTELKNEGYNERISEIHDMIDACGLSDVTTHFGVVEFMPELIASSDIVVLPFRTTSGPSDYPVVLLEAMASGTAVISTSVGGIPELIDDGNDGLLVDIDENDLTKNISKLIGDPLLRKKLASTARKKVENAQSQPSPAEVILKKYNKVISNNG